MINLKISALWDILCRNEYVQKTNYHLKY